MPMAPGRACSTPGCPEIITRVKPCAKHGNPAKERRKNYDRTREGARARGYDVRWERARKAYLQANPLCSACDREGRVTAAHVVDHIRPHRGGMGVFWAPGNLQSLCSQHDDSKRARENGIASCHAHGAAPSAIVLGETICVDCGRAAVRAAVSC